MTVLGILCASAGLPALETSLLILIGTPVWAFLVGRVFPLTAVSYFLILVISFVVLYFIKARPTRAERIDSLKQNSPDLILYLLIFALNYNLALSWPDFFPMGERLRDYALLASSIHDPLSSAEPWFFGHLTSYYLFWYRFAHSLSRLLSLEVWDAYHFMNAWALSLVWAGIYSLSRATKSFGIVGSLLVASLVCYGSNVDGIALWWRGTIAQDGWWGPSRVIKGAINEFPAWSFLLGDNHPHFLSYGLASLSLASLIRVMGGAAPGLKRTVAVFCLGCVMTLLVINGNAWETPMWLGLITLMGASYLPLGIRGGNWRQHFTSLPDSGGRIAVIILAAGAATISLLWSASNISSGDTPVHLVTGRAPFSTTKEILLHWGIPLALLLISHLASSHFSVGVRLLVAAAVGTSLISNDAFPLILSLLAVEIASHWDEIRSDRVSDNHLVTGAITISALGLILLCELCFLDDPYGGENERMNTIFKCYAFSWGLLHLGAVARFWRVFGHYARSLHNPQLRGLIHGAAAIVVGICSAFFITVASDYRPKEARGKDPEGLSRVQQELPGSQETIRVLRSLPFGAVLEGQGNPYSWTSHISTLSGMPSYLGWSNHVSLLVRKPHEIARREDNTRRWYTSDDCATVKSELLAEKVSYAVVGPLERAKYGEQAGRGLSCLTSVGNYEQYRLYKVS